MAFSLFLNVSTFSGHGFWGVAFYVFIFASGAFAAALMRRWHTRQNELLNYSLTGLNRVDFERGCGVSPEVRTYLAERLMILASLLSRASSEICVGESQPPAGLAVITRQIQNTLLRENGLWGKLEQIEGDFSSAPDGSWSAEHRQLVFTWCEQLRVLRWVLGLDFELLPLEHFPKLDYSLARSVVESRKSLAGNPLATSWDIRVQRNLALAYTARVIAELKVRGLISGSPELEGWADELRAKSLGESTDYLAGAMTIADLEDSALRNLALFAAARERYCSYLLELLNSTQPFPFSTWAG